MQIIFENFVKKLCVVVYKFRKSLQEKLKLSDLVNCVWIGFHTKINIIHVCGNVGQLSRLARGTVLYLLVSHEK